MVAELILIPAGPSALEPAKQCAQYVARGLSSIGIKVREQISLCNSKAELQKAVAAALGRSNVVIALGGLSKQQSYLSKTVIAQGLGLELAENAVCLDAIRAYCSKTGETFSGDDRAYAMLPQGSVAFPGQYGKIPGFAISSAKQHIILMPDAQTEAAAMLNKYISPYLSGTESQTTVTRTVRTYGIGAEQVRALLCELLDTANPAVTVDKEGGEVLVRVSAHAAGSQQAAALCTPVLRQLVDRLGDAAYGLDVDSLESAVVSKLRKKQLDIAVAEAGSDGMLTRVIMETNGGAEILRYSVNVDSDEAKTQKLSVDAKLLKKRGGVSEESAVHMANGARLRGDAGIGVGICANTMDEKKKKCPIGLVYIAVCDANTCYVKKLVVGSGDPMERDLVIDAAVSRALNMTRLFVDYLPGAYTGAIPLEEALGGRAVTDKDSYISDGPANRGPGQKGFFGKLFGNFIIRKADETRIKVRKVIFILAVLVFLGSGGYVGKYYYDSYKAAKQAQELQQLFTFGDMGGDVEIAADYPKDYLGNFAGLWNLNRDVVAYINIPDTQVQYPIVQAEDNDFYLRRDFYKGRNDHGIPFMDYKVNVKKPSDNMVVYGHNMKDGQIFGEIIPYQKLEYYREHPIIEFSTVYEAAKYKVFAVFITNGRSEQGTVFEYHNFVDAASGDDFMKYVNQVRIRSILNLPVDVEAGDELLTLSTCSYEFTEARFVVVARKVRSGEDEDVDVSLAELNKQPLYPDIWYKTYGGTKPIGLDSATVVTTPTTNSPSASSQSPSPASSSSSTSSTSQSVSSTPPASSTPASSAASSQSQVQSQSQSQVQSQSQSQSQSQQQSQSQAESQSSQAQSSASESDPGLILSDPGNDDDGGDDGNGDDINLNLAVKAPIGILHQKASAATVAIVPMSVSEPSFFDYIDIDPPNRQGDSYDPGSIFGSGSGSSFASQAYAGTITANANGQVITADAADVVARIVQSEMGGTFNKEALKAQAVAAYSYILFQNNKGQTPSVILAPSSAVTQKTRDAVDQVIGQAVYYNGSVAFTPYHATSAGQTTSSQAVWGGSYPYLTSVESQVDRRATNYKVAWTYSSDEISDKLYNKLGIDTFGDPGDWFETLTLVEGDYNGKMAVCGETTSLKTGNVITGRMLRENVLGLRSACFTVDYNEGSDQFTFTTYGYGHGVGMSQNGANFYAQDGWSYKEILEHYYAGCVVQ